MAAASRSSSEFRSLPRSSLPTSLPLHFARLRRDQLHEGHRRLAHLLHRHAPAVVQVLVLAARRDIRTYAWPAMAFTTASGTPCCLARSWKLCRMPCTVTGRSMPAITCTSRHTSLSWSLPTGRVPASDREQEPGRETWVASLRQVAPVPAHQVERPRLQRDRSPIPAVGSPDRGWPSWLAPAGRWWWRAPRGASRLPFYAALLAQFTTVRKGLQRLAPRS